MTKLYAHYTKLLYYKNMRLKARIFRVPNYNLRAWKSIVDRVNIILDECDGWSNRENETT